MSKEHWEIVAAGGIVIAITPEQLWNLAVEYFKWNKNNPIEYKETMKSGKTQGQKVTVEKQRPMTIRAFCLHAGIPERYLMDIKNMYGEQSEWYQVAEKIISIIFIDNLEGAIVDLYNPIVVSKILNLDKPQTDDSRPVRVEIIDSGKNNLPTTEQAIIDNLDFDTINRFENKLAEEQSKEHSTHKSA